MAICPKPLTFNYSGKNLLDLRLQVGGSQTKMLEEIRALARSPETLDTHDAALRADVAPPRLRGAGFDREAARARRRQHALAIWRRLRIERLAARHGHEAHAFARGLQFLDGFGRESDFRARRDHDGFRRSVAVD